ncbi:two-component regulator propeller domain-containing protein [Hymenobacter sp. BRD67]|uniref:two-component regulator propeller domain-containing protein n=1 Tax=Hymenobacter sp. BRD67 TaxID=2675877 RepID=UPI0015665320|nr:two-component regulator propeller domain-containing protein [Hymenobacter sp. BRD67]QKG53635.1 hypothetical protein GKZ67_14790 [Hymenobacter sp. BRD67]
MSQPFIYCLLQDRQGYLWLGTAEGLVRYDGSRFVTLTTRDGLAENFVTGLWEDPASGALWVLHHEGSRSVRLAGDAFRAAPTTTRGGPAGRVGSPAPDTARLGRIDAASTCPFLPMWYPPACSKTVKAMPGWAPPAKAYGSTPTAF